MALSLDSKYVKGLDKAVARMEKMRGKPLEQRTAKALLEGARLMVAPIRAAAPREAAPGTEKGPWSASDGPGQLQRAVKARKGRSGPMVAVVGPTAGGAAHRHLVVHGHQVYSHGQPTGFRTDPNPFVMRGVESVLGQVKRDVSKLILQTDGRL